MKRHTPAEHDKIIKQVEEIVITQNVNVTNAINQLGLSQNILSCKYLKDKKKAIIEAYKKRNNIITKTKADEYVKPKPSPYKPIYKPTLSDRNYLF